MLVGARAHFANLSSKQEEVKNMALYEDFDLDITTGKENNENDARRLSGVDCYTDYETCKTECSAQTCTGIRTRPCDR